MTVRRTTIALAVAAVLLALLFFAVPVLIKVDRYRPQVISPLEPIGSAQIKPGEVTASNLLPSDAPGPVLFEAHDISSELANVNIEAIINPSSASVDALGSLKAGRLRFGSVHAANVNTKLRLEERQIVFSNVTAQMYGGSVNGEFVFKLSGKTPSFATKAEVHG